MSTLPISASTIDTLSTVATYAWWSYILFVVLFFFGGLILNYIVKKINEARLETRFLNLTKRASTNQATQILRPMTKEAKLPATNNGISLVFNKEDNLLEDKRKKDEFALQAHPIQVNVTIASNENLEDKSVGSAKDLEFSESLFLGSIYKDLFESRKLQKSRSLSITQKDSILSEIFNKMVWKKIMESRSTPSLKVTADEES